MTRDEYEAGIAYAKSFAESILNNGGWNGGWQTPDETWNGAHTILDALLLLEGSIKLGACPWNYDEPGGGRTVSVEGKPNSRELSRLLAEEVEYFARDVEYLGRHLHNHQMRHARLRKLSDNLARITAWSDLLAAEGQ